ncbi:MAG: DHA2 family efflux MFS transporter permease subunit [Candidatus Saccharimonadales bacterium]
MTSQQRLVLVISILASFVAFLDSSVVNVALPAISKELGGGLLIQQWVADAYLITLGSLILLAGSLSDLYGRKRILIWGLVGFGITSILCAIAQNGVFLVIARGLQGIAGALLVPSSLALIISAFKDAPQAKAIGTWTAWTGVAFIIGPLLGGFLIDNLSWRWIFGINIIPIAVCLWLLSKLTQKFETKKVKLDIFGAILCSVGLSGFVFGLIEQPRYGWTSLIISSFVGGILCLVGFILYERRARAPMLPLSLFTIRNFSVGNLATIAIYGGLSIATFLIVIFLQQDIGYSAFSSGLSLLPITIIMFLLSPKFGALAGKYGPRIFMALGPVIGGLGFIIIGRHVARMDYWTWLFPGVIVFSLGLSMTVAPLTAAVLGSIKPEDGGIASAVNNAIARVAGLITIAFIGVVVAGNLNVVTFRRSIVFTGGLLILGGVISAIGIQDSKKQKDQSSQFMKAK